MTVGDFERDMKFVKICLIVLGIASIVTSHTAMTHDHPHAPHSHPETAHSHDDSAIRQLDNRISNLAGQVMAHSNELESLSGHSAQPTKYRVTKQYTNVRTRASTDSDIIESLFVGEQVTVTGESGEWYSVLYGDQSGFIHQSLLEAVR